MVLGIDEKIWLDSTKINFIVGEGGCAKSSDTVKFLKEHHSESDILWTTSTHQNRKSAEKRFGIEASTIAGGLFKTKGGRFYAEMKEPKQSVIVLDEFLQADKKVFDWALAFAGKKKIIFLGDTHQMLAPEQEGMIQKCMDFMKRPEVVVSELKYTMRAWDDETRKAYSYYYNLPDDIMHSTEKLKTLYPTINYEDMPFNTDDIYICHKNSFERWLYLDKQLASRDDIERIAKGTIAGQKNPSTKTYPTLCQEEAEKSKSKAYFQVANVATATRFQGSEVPDGNKLYYMIPRNSKISNREVYTVITRLHHISDLVLVDCGDIPELQDLKTFKGKPVKKEVYLHIDYDGESQFVTKKEMHEFLEKNYPDTDTIYYNKEVVYSNKFSDKDKIVAMQVKGAKLYQPEFSGKKISAGSLARRDGALQYSYIPAIYKELEENDLNHIRAPRLLGRSPKNRGISYQLDLSGAYPLILKYCEMPIDGTISYTEDKELMNFYIYKGSAFSNGSIMNDVLADLVKTEGLGEVKYIFSVPKKVGCSAGEYLYDMYHKSIEDKAKTKDEIHYGYWEKPYIKLSPEGDCYLIKEQYRYELLMASIISYQSYYIYNLQKAMEAKYHLVDAVYMEEYPDDEMFKRINSVLPGFLEWKIVDNKADKVVYMNYEPPKSKADNKKEKMRAKRAAMTEEEKEAQRAKDRERKRLAKQNNS